MYLNFMVCFIFQIPSMEKKHPFLSGLYSFNINQTGSLAEHLQTNLHIMKCKGTPPSKKSGLIMGLLKDNNV